MHDHPKTTFGFIAIVIAAFGLIALVLSGTQVSTILSKVGASVGSGTVGSGVNFEEGANPPAEEPAPTQAAGGTAAPGQLAVAVQPALLIVRTGTLRLEIGSAAALPSTVSKAANLVTAGGGYVAGSKETGAAADASATVDYRIPATAWEQTLAGLRSLATVKGQEIGTEEVTGKVVDLGARIANLRATEAALQAIMAKATKINDVLDVQRQLTDTRGQIEELSAQKAGLEDRAAYGSLTVIFEAPAAPTPRATPAPAAAWDPGADIQEASAKLVRIGQRATTAGIWIAIIGGPLLVAVLLALGIAWLGWRLGSRLRRRTPPIQTG